MEENQDSKLSENEIKHFTNMYSNQLSASGVPTYFWPALAWKLKNQVYDAGPKFQVWKCLDESKNSDEDEFYWKVTVICPEGIKTNDPNQIFLIDHAWTYQSREARTSLYECKGLLKRMCSTFEIKTKNKTYEEKISEVLEKMWLFNGTYSIGKDHVGNSMPFWYIMDEFGTKIQHDGEPNFRIVPFYYEPRNCCYSLLFPIQDVEEGEEVTRNYVETPPVDDLTRDAQMLPWFPLDLSHIDVTIEEPPLEFIHEYKMKEDFPENFSASSLPKDRVINVYTDYDFVKKYLTHKQFKVVENEEDAVVMWVSHHFTNYKKLAETPYKRVNQFPNEQWLTLKNLLAVVSRRVCNSSTVDPVSKITLPVWTSPSFCLKKDLVQFVSYFQRREKLGLDNTWIIKPWNLGRGLDITITSNLNHILRLPATGPKIAQKYLHNPVLFHRDDIHAKVKFDLRFIVLLSNVKPLCIGVYKNFWIRFANKEFSLSDFQDYEKHFTVNNYNESFLLQMYCSEFINKFEYQYPAHSWSEVKEKIYSMFKELFEAATMYDYPRGIANNPQSRACYGIDLMLDWEKDVKGDEVIQPKLLEVNFNPDNKRACEYYEDFYNDMFQFLFLEDSTPETIERI